MSEIDVNSNEIDQLATQVEEAARAARKTIGWFVEPARGTLRRAKSARHHIVFGRRGSGKTSLLLKAESDLSSQGSPTAYVDLERFKGHQYPDVLISVLIAAFGAFRDALTTQPPSSSSAAKRVWWKRIFRRADREPSKHTLQQIDTLLSELSQQLLLVDNSEVTVRQSASEDRTRALTAGAATPTYAGVSLEAGLESRSTRSSSQTTEETARRSKTEFLLRKTIDYSRVLASISQSAGHDAYLFLDDLYHIRKSDQPHVLDYFHRLCKGNGAWLKVGTVRHRSVWSLPGDPPVGLGLGDDADEINLDLTLEQFATAKTFLLSILAAFIVASHSPNSSLLLADGAADRLVLGSGGVARDFLGIFRRSIDHARARLEQDPKHYRGTRIGVEDVNLAIGEYGDNKIQEFVRDTLDDKKELDPLFESIQRFCTSEANANCFLVDQASPAQKLASLSELVDLRLVHLVRSHVTVSKRPGRLFKAYMLDVSLYTGERKRRDLQLVEFWKRGSEEQLRRTGLILDITE